MWQEHYRPAQNPDLASSSRPAAGTSGSTPVCRCRVPNSLQKNWFRSIRGLPTNPLALLTSICFCNKIMREGRVTTVPGNNGCRRSSLRFRQEAKQTNRRADCPQDVSSIASSRRKSRRPKEGNTHCNEGIMPLTSGPPPGVAEGVARALPAIAPP